MEVGRPKEKRMAGDGDSKKLLFLLFLSDCMAEKLYNESIGIVELLERERKIAK
jgi:hypothetical protein